MVPGTVQGCMRRGREGTGAERDNGARDGAWVHGKVQGTGAERDNPGRCKVQERDGDGVRVKGTGRAR